MFELIVSSFLFILPAYFANMCPLLFGKMGMPFGRAISFRWFGKNKTWRGFYSGFFGAVFILAIERELQIYGIFEQFWLLDYSLINLILYGFLFGVGTIFGDLVESFVKRRLGLASGKLFFPFDQLDFVLGVYLFLLPVYVVEWKVLLILLIMTPFLHFLANVLAYLLGVKKVWW